ncbi:MAG: 1-(5-phosphoribosyl)-5-[(5-phosphoribosylamino)methylideneamino]imidazole-4-carboxamide isomerase [Chloroflexi bacterium]|nr:1-(5-phosphoribosyl)-5-[(5-phosphoribosylamino)methylideneamino]imidazole-4-carboxamide isomerase [Chloroflexota bacterium]|tara:strand:- start:32890 stop:33597 length:708 start_codon:yes stop_codon:yes gene_type:complete
MKIFPAIDIRNGKCVRLIKGDYDNEVVFNEDPYKVAKNFEDIGSKYVHIIDLDGAKDGISTVKDNITKIINNTNLKIQVGGGIRTFEKAESFLNLGVSKIIFGTAALENKSDVLEAIKKYNSQIIVSIDALNGKVKTKGWLQDAGIDVKDLVIELQDNGCKNFIYTDIEKDGTLTHPNFKYISDLRKICESELYIAGGISDINDISKLKNLGIDGAILGMSIYTGKIDLNKLLNQ